MKNKTTASPNKSPKKGNKPQNPKANISPIVKAKEVAQSPKNQNGKTKPKQNGTAKGPKSNKNAGKQLQSPVKAIPEEKVLVAAKTENVPKNKKQQQAKTAESPKVAPKAQPKKNKKVDIDSDDETEAKKPKISPFAGTAALDQGNGEPKTDGKQGKQGKKQLQAVTKAKERQQKQKQIKVENKQDKTKKLTGKALPKVQAPKGKNANQSRKISLVKTVMMAYHEKDTQLLQNLLPQIASTIEKAKAQSTSSAKRKVRILKSFQKKIQAGDYSKPEAVSHKEKNKPKLPKGMPDMNKDDSEDDEDDEDETEDVEDSVTQAENDQEVEADSDDEDDEDDADEQSDEDEDDEEEESDDEIAPKEEPKIQQDTQETQQQGKKKRYVLFVGNISYETKEEEIKEHFKKAGEVVSVRMGKDAQGKSKGFSHIEFNNSTSYEKALSMNHTFLNKRRINVNVSESKQNKNGNAKADMQSVGQKRKNDPKFKDTKLKAMQNKGQLAGSVKESNKRSARRKKAAAAQKSAE